MGGAPVRVLTKPLPAGTRRSSAPWTRSWARCGLRWPRGPSSRCQPAWAPSSCMSTSAGMTTCRPRDLWPPRGVNAASASGTERRARGALLQKVKCVCMERRSYLFSTEAGQRQSLRGAPPAPEELPRVREPQPGLAVRTRVPQRPRQAGRPRPRRPASKCRCLQTRVAWPTVHLVRLSGSQAPPGRSACGRGGALTSGRGVVVRNIPGAPAPPSRGRPRRGHCPGRSFSPRGSAHVSISSSTVFV